MKVTIPQWLKDEDSKTAEFYEFINAMLEACPEMTLAEFAQDLDFGVKQQTLKRVKSAEKTQFGGVSQ